MTCKTMVAVKRLGARKRQSLIDFESAPDSYSFHQLSTCVQVSEVKANVYSLTFPWILRNLVDLLQDKYRLNCSFYRKRETHSNV